MMIKMIDIENTSKNIKELIKKSGIKISEMQKIFGFDSPQSLYKWMSCKYMNLPTLQNCVILADILHCKIDDLLVIKDTEVKED